MLYMELRLFCPDGWSKMRVSVLRLVIMGTRGTRYRFVWGQHHPLSTASAEMVILVLFVS